MSKIIIARLNILKPKTYQTKPQAARQINVINMNSNIAQNVIRPHNIDLTCEMCHDMSWPMDKVMVRDLNHYQDIRHEVSSYVDDSSSNIGIEDNNLIIPYIKDY